MNARAVCVILTVLTSVIKNTSFVFCGLEGGEAFLFDCSGGREGGGGSCMSFGTIW